MRQSCVYLRYGDWCGSIPATDNAACEGLFRRLKTELFYPRHWRSTTIEQFTQALDSYIRG